MAVDGFTLSGIVALAAAFLVQFGKRAVPKAYHKFIPLPIAIVCIAVGVFVAWWRGLDLLDGGLYGFAAAAFAVYGYEVTEIFKKKAG